MGLLGGLLIFLSLPLFIGHFLSDKKNPMRLRLGILLFVVGVLVVLSGNLVR